jgi:hypothetical protein
MSEALRSEPIEETPVETPEVELVPQPHGGALRRGGTNRGGPGMPPSRIRQLAREMFVTRGGVNMLGDMMQGVVELPIREVCPKCSYEPTHEERLQALKDRVKPSDRIRAADVLQKIGMSTAVSVDDVRARLIEQVRSMRAWAKEAGLTSPQVEQLLDELDSVWR